METIDQSGGSCQIKYAFIDLKTNPPYQLHEDLRNSLNLLFGKQSVVEGRTERANMYPPWVLGRPDEIHQSEIWYIREIRPVILINQQ